jgi:hypothetical protein
VVFVIPVDGRSVGKPPTHPTPKSIGQRDRRLPYDSLEPQSDGYGPVDYDTTSLKARNSIRYILFHHDLFPTTLTFIYNQLHSFLIAITFHLFNSIPTNPFARMNSETMTKKRPVDILTHKNWREWFQLIELYFTGEELDFVLHETEEEYCVVIGFTANPDPIQVSTHP